MKENEVKHRYHLKKNTLIKKKRLELHIWMMVVSGRYILIWFLVVRFHDEVFTRPT
jgi:hypothetical protein